MRRHHDHHHLAAALLASAVGLAVLLAAPGGAEARRFNPGYVAHHPPPLAYKWRVHGYFGAEPKGFVVLGQGLENFGALGHGGGFGVFGGVRLGKWAAVEVNWGFTIHDEYHTDEAGTTMVDNWNSHQLHALTADFKLHIPTFTRVEPFIQVGGGYAFFGVTGLDKTIDAQYLYKRGPMFNVGGGLNAWLGPYFSLGGRVLYQGIYLTDAIFDVTVDENGTKNEYTSPSDYINGLSVSLFGSFHF